MFVYLVTFCIVSVLFRFWFFLDNFFALLHVLTNQSRYKYVSLYWVHSASYLTLMNKVLLEEVDSRSYPYPHKKSHNTCRWLKLKNWFFLPQLFPHFVLLWYPPFSPLGILLSKLLWQVNQWRSSLSEFNFLCDCIIWLNLWF